MSALCIVLLLLQIGVVTGLGLFLYTAKAATANLRFAKLVKTAVTYMLLLTYLVYPFGCQVTTSPAAVCCCQANFDCVSS